MCNERVVGVFGGSFDPVHLGHLCAASQAKRFICADEMRLLPCYLPVHKARTSASADDRLNMLGLALEAFPELAVDAREVQLGRPCYTYDTLLAIREDIGTRASLVFTMGWDSLQQFDRWYNWRAILDIANIAAVTRPGYRAVSSPDVNNVIKAKRVAGQDLPRYTAGRIAILEIEEVDAASSELRRQLEGADFESTGADGFKQADTDMVDTVLLPEVRRYIVENALYRVAKQVPPTNSA